MDGQYLDFYKKYEEKCGSLNNYIPSVFDPVKRIIVMGDVHGDYSMVIQLLKKVKLIKIINQSVIWTGGDTFLVQVGDQLDGYRPDNPNTLGENITKINKSNNRTDDIKVFDLFTELSEQAIKHGGRVISLLGNHELMNTQGDMRYVSYTDLTKFSKQQDPKEGYYNRIEQFKPGNIMSVKMACTRKAAVIIGSNLFVHGGMINDIVDQLLIKDRNDIETINQKICLYLLGNINKNNVELLINSKRSIFWNRILGEIPPNIHYMNSKCVNQINKVLHFLKVDHIIVGHTPQFSNNFSINSTCDDKVWRVDTGCSVAFDKFFKDKKKCQLLEIIDDHIFNIID